jgi:thiol:disulfide interchange protein
MPFGLIFGALFFAVVCGSLGLRWLAHPTVEAKIGGALLVILGCSLALGLLMRRRWARWTGAAVGALLGAFGLRLVAVEGGVIEHVTVLAALAAAVLLAVPATGDPTRGATPRAVAASSTVGPLGWIALASLVGLLAAGMSAETETTSPVSAREGGLPASAIGKRVRWADFGGGIARAGAEGKPVLATFVTDWCPYCTEMARETWRASSVAERLDDFVPVRVDVEDAGATGGYTGPELAARYGVAGYPVQIVLDSEGRVLARYDGYQSPRQLLAWLDELRLDDPASGSATSLAEPGL